MGIVIGLFSLQLRQSTFRQIVRDGIVRAIGRKRKPF